VRGVTEVKRSVFGAVAFAAVALSVVFIGSAGAKPAPPPASSGGCPSGSLSNYPTSGIVGYSITNATNTTSTYKFFSQNQNPTGGVPGLQGYCVYTTPAPKSDTTTGGDVPTWKASKPATNFGFTRPGGESTNIPLDGNTYTVGFATWTGSAPAPAAQQVLLHLSGSAAGVCNGLPSCFVRPTLTAGPICDAGTGNTRAGYNALPTDIGLKCPPQDSYSFEGLLPTKEFGDQVQLNTTSGTTFDKMTVSFASFGCGDSGHWYDLNGDCMTSANTTFTIPDGNNVGSGGLHARLYSVKPDGSVDAQLGVDAVNNNPIPFRPSADNVKCVNPGTDANGGDDRGKWYNAAANLCMNSYPFLVSFDFSGQNITVPANDTVVWTVWYDTSNAGMFPLGNNTACRIAGDPGCGYDSLNVGSWTFANAPYAGTDVVPAEAWVDDGLGGGLIAHTNSVDFTDYTPAKPLAEITLK
jgi:hypothetical protein